MADIDKLDKKVKLKKIFYDIPINEDGMIMINHIGRKLKSVTTQDG